jgi:hypothetical protein
MACGGLEWASEVPDEVIARNNDISRLSVRERAR